jgi:uncharacterized RDD family membrane protein YckC
MADITFECPECKQHLVIDAGDAGSEIQCPTCFKIITVPQTIIPAPTQIAGASGYARLFTRFAAGCVDFIVLYILSSILIAVILDIGNSEGLIPACGDLLVVLNGWIYYSVLLSSSWQATLGMKVLKIKITDKTGGRISFGCASVRYFVSLLSALPFFAGFLMIPFTGKKQGFHDMMAGTYVLKNNASLELPQIAISNATTANAEASLTTSSPRQYFTTTHIVIVCATIPMLWNSNSFAR